MITAIIYSSCKNWEICSAIFAQLIQEMKNFSSIHCRTSYPLIPPYLLLVYYFIFITYNNYLETGLKIVIENKKEEQTVLYDYLLFDRPAKKYRKC